MGATFDPCSRQMVSAAVRDALAAVGCDPTRIAGVSCRKGGISAAVEAGVDECILYLLSGHGPKGEREGERAHVYVCKCMRT